MKKISIYPLSESKQKKAIQEQKAVDRALAISSDEEIEELPLLPKDRMEWEYACRPTIKGVPNRLKNRPMMIKIIKDEHPFKFLLLARQWGKTTGIASNLAYHASTKNNFDQMYFNFKEANLKTFTENKFRQDVFGDGPLSKYVAGISRLGSMNRIVLKTKSAIDMLLPGINWANALGGSNMRMEIDEGQDHDWNGFSNARETQADTMGDLGIYGVGHFKNTPYHNIWGTTNQMEYFFRRGEIYKGYENMSWRADLDFDDDGLVEDEYLLDVLDGDFNPQAPKNFSRHGYHLSQLQNPRIPLTMESAIEDYKVSPEWSIEWKRKVDPNYSWTDYARNVLAEFVEGELKPLTTEDMIKLFDKTQHLTKAEDVVHDTGKVIVGIDWGGGGKTILWIWQCIDEKAKIFKLLWVEKIDTASTKEQLRICIDLIDAYEADFVCVDAGGASDRVQGIQERYGSRSVRVSYHPRPEKPLPSRDELRTQRRELRYVIDRTFSIDRIIDLIKNPYKEKSFSSPRIILPGADYEEIKWIVRQFVALEGEKAKLKSTGQTYIKYTHKDSEPDDALQACNFAYIGWDILRSKGGPIEFQEFKPKDPFGDGYESTPIS